MVIKDLFDSKKTVYSFEIFPPKPDSPIEIIYNTLEKLKNLRPDYISVTYTNLSESTIKIARLVKEKYNIEPLVHLIAIHSEKEDIQKFLEQLDNYGIHNILALRGDIKQNLPVSKDFRYAADLVKFIKKTNPLFSISGGCYPEGHFESRSLAEDIKRLKEKTEAGVCHLNSQLFYDNEDFYRFLDMTSLAGINVPIQAGIMPLIKKSQIERIIGLTGVKIPAKISRMLAKFGDNKQALFDAGIAYATEQIIDLLSYGVKGIHLYIMNNAEVADKITENINSIING